MSDHSAPLPNPPRQLFREAEGVLPNSLALLWTSAAWAGSFALMATSSWTLRLLGVLLCTHAMLLAAYLVHEAAHHTLFAAARANRWAGEWMSFIAGSSYASFDRIRHLHLRHHRDRHDLQPMQPAASRDVAQLLHLVSEHDHRDRGGSGKTEPGEERAGQTRPHQTQRNADLAARGPGQELAQRDEVGVGAVVEPPPPLHVLRAEVAEVRDRAAERGQSEAQRHEEDLDHAAQCVPISHRLADACNHRLGRGFIWAGNLDLQLRASTCAESWSSRRASTTSC